MSGRPAGGGQAANPLLGALAGPAQSVQGGLGDIGPPPVTPGALPAEASSSAPSFPSFMPQPVLGPQSQAAGGFPSTGLGSTSPIFPSFFSQLLAQPDPRRRTNAGFF